MLFLTTITALSAIVGLTHGAPILASEVSASPRPTFTPELFEGKVLDLMRGRLFDDPLFQSAKCTLHRRRDGLWVCDSMTGSMPMPEKSVVRPASKCTLRQREDGSWVCDNMTGPIAEVVPASKCTLRQRKDGSWVCDNMTGPVAEKSGIAPEGLESAQGRCTLRQREDGNWVCDNMTE